MEKKRKEEEAKRLVKEEKEKEIEKQLVSVILTLLLSESKFMLGVYLTSRL